jgi:2-oxoisovalerate dehydrogenase E1 component alpha subunit
LETVVPQLAPEVLVQMHEHMLTTRLVEERTIAMWKSGHGYFWIGGPGEEAFNVPLGMLVHKGEGPLYDYLHMHYRSNGVVLAMGEDPIHILRQMKNTATDPYSGGRNFVSHCSIRKWNVVPISSPIEVQYTMAPGTAIAQKRAGGRGITIVTGGDAGTAEGDFACSLVWSSRPGNELPMLIVVTNNRYGISTPYEQQHGEPRVSDRGRAFGMRCATINGNDPELTYHALQAAMEYVRNERKPYLLEAMVSRLYTHSSATGANYVQGEVDCLVEFEKKLEARGVLTRAEMDEKRQRIYDRLQELARQVIQEPQPEGADAFKYIYADRDVVGEGHKVS